MSAESPGCAAACLLLAMESAPDLRVLRRWWAQHNYILPALPDDDRALVLVAFCRQAIDLVADLAELADWWTAFNGMIRALAPASRSAIIAAKDARKIALAELSISV